VAVNPADHSVWVGTGEGNSNSDGVGGTGVYRSTDGGQTWTQAGTGLTNTLVTHIEFAGTKVYVATNQGLVRHDAAATDGAWRPSSSPTRTPATRPTARPGSPTCGPNPAATARAWWPWSAGAEAPRPTT
jgi:hypothetical protein